MGIPRYTRAQFKVTRITGALLCAYHGQKWSQRNPVDTRDKVSFVIAAVERVDLIMVFIIEEIALLTKTH